MVKGVVYLIMLLPAIVSVSGIEPSMYDAPPLFILPANLTIPQSLVKIGNISDRYNTIYCSVKNADDVRWVYSKHLHGIYTDSLPKDAIEMEKLEQDQKTKNLIRIISDKNAKSKSGKKKLNGYYKCVAENNFGYRIETPPIRLIIPSVHYTTEDERPDIINLNGQETRPYRLPCLNREKVNLAPDDLLNWDLVNFFWAKVFSTKRGTAGDKLGFNWLDPTGPRMKIDPRTGDLFFSYLKSSDKTGLLETSPEYHCIMTVVGTTEMKVAGRYRLSVSADKSNPPVALAYPVMARDREVTCLEGELCTITCIYGGGASRTEEPSTIEWIRPDNHGKDVAITLEGNSIIFTAYEEAAGNWTCKTKNKDHGIGIINVKVKLYPKVFVGDMRDRFVEVGSDVDFACSPIQRNSKTKVTYYVNGKLYNDGTHQVRLKNVRRNNSGAVSCLATNDAGVKYASAQLMVYSKPVVRITPESGHFLTKNYTEENLLFECSAEVDPKVIKAEIYWMSYHTNLKGVKLAVGQKQQTGIRGITSYFDKKNNTVYSSLRFDYIDSTMQKDIVGGVWWCVVDMEFYGKPTPISVESTKIPFDVAKRADKGTVATAGFDNWWLIGVIVAIFFMILIIVLIVCCVRQHQGEDYYVDEKERKAGHNPEEEMGLYGFSDYKRPATGGYTPMYMSDQDPIKGSRASLDRSERPLDSDSEGMDEYGDIDPGRFNEDGSFIGAYGKSSTHIDV